MIFDSKNNPEEKREIYFLNDKQNFPYNVPLHKVSPSGGNKGEKLNRICKWIKSSRDGEKFGCFWCWCLLFAYCRSLRTSNKLYLTIFPFEENFS